MRNDHNNEGESAVVGLVWGRWISLITRPSLGKLGLVLLLAVRSNSCPPIVNHSPNMIEAKRFCDPGWAALIKPCPTKFSLCRQRPQRYWSSEIGIDYKTYLLHVSFSITSLSYQLETHCHPMQSQQRFFWAKLHEGNGVVTMPSVYHIAPCELIFSFEGSRPLDSPAIFIENILIRVAVCVHRVGLFCSRLQCSPLPPIPDFCPLIRCLMPNHSRVWADCSAPRANLTVAWRNPTDQR